MKVLVLNSGSSSVKFQLFEFDGKGTVLAKGLAERIGLSAPRLKIVCPTACDGRSEFEAEDIPMPDHRAAIDQICQYLLSKECGCLSDIAELAGIGHRVVHGGERFTGSVLIDDEVIAGIEDCSRLAPLHNPPALLGIRACADRFTDIPQVAVFDTAFHHTIPESTYIYGIPIKFYREHRIRKYGFHGTSHMYVAQETARLCERDIKDMKIITCHLGNGASITAVDGGLSVDTSMGLTPLGGVMMGTRPGDFDPYVPIYMHRECGIPIAEVDLTLNKKSGLKGICGLADVRDIVNRAKEGNKDCQLALRMYCYRIRRYVGMYAMVLGGVDAIVFTAGVGENNPELRGEILATAGFLGVEIDQERNSRNETVISTNASRVKVMVVPTNEELVIARETRNLVEQKSLV